ncbi:MAG: uroporphyrinogen-III C-methyltransferase [Alkalimonas sp.]|nr:uroporphyrinogen-III C-methyltransferase [Alkalimonas sp.]
MSREPDTTEAAAAEATPQEGDAMRYLSEEAMQEPALKTGRGIAWLALWLLLMLLAALTAAAWWLYPQFQQLSQLPQQQQQQWERLFSEERRLLQQQSRQVQADMQAGQESWLRQQRLQQQEQQQHLQQQAAQFQQQLRFLEQRLEQQQGAAPSIWLLAEVDYLLRMASQKIWLELDVATSQQLLKSADSRLAQLAEPSLVMVREAIRQDQQALARLRIPDPVETQLAIRALRDQALELPFTHHAGPALKAEVPAEQGWPQRWRQLWRQGLSQLVQVRRATADDEFSLSAEQEFIVQQRLQQQLVQAELAALQQQTPLFRASLQEAKSLVQRFYLDSAPATQQLLARLEALIGKQLHPGHIAPLQSLEALQRYQRTIDFLSDEAGEAP